MNRRVAQRIFEKVSPLVAKQLGVGAFGDPGQLLFGRKGAASQGWKYGGAAALSGGGHTAVSRGLMQRGDRADIRGALIHELTHRYDEAYGLKDSETRADAVRLAVNGRRGSLQGAYNQWEPGRGVTKYARQQGWGAAGGNQHGQGNNDMAGHSGTNRNGPTYANRNRNTTRNNASHGTGASGNRPDFPKYPLKGNGPAPMPTLMPSQEAGYATQIAGLQRNLAAAQALAKANIAAARGQYQSAHAEADKTQIDETATAVNHALDSHTFGSSFDLGARAGAVTDAAQQLQDARLTRDQAIAQERVGVIGAQGDFYTGLGGIQADRGAAEAEAAAQAYQNDMFNSVTQDFGALKQAALAALAANNGRRRDGNSRSGNGGGGGGGTAAPFQKAGTLNTLYGGKALAEFYKKRNMKDTGFGAPGLPYTPYGAF